MDALNKAIGKRKAQVWAVKLYAVKDETFHHGGKAPPHGFDFWEFWHEAFLIFDAGCRK